MADTELTSAADAETQAKAEAMGWIPPSRFKGDPAGFVDAAAYIENGEKVLPIVKAALAKERENAVQLNRRLKETEAAVERATKALEEIELKNSVATQKAVEAAKKEVREQLEAASAAGDHKAVAALTEEMVALNSAPPPEEKKETPPPKDVVISPEQLEWQDANPWYGKDRRKTALMLAVAQDLREQGDARTGKAFMNACKAEMEKTLGETGGETKVAGGGRNGSDNEDSQRSAGRRSYSSMPADARAACDADARNFVGPNKKYKDQASWREAYAAIYFS